MILADILRYFFGIEKPKRKRNKKKNPQIEKLRKEAKSILPKRLDELAKLNGFKYNDIRIKNVKTRWGSCSYKNNINLNLHLMKLNPNLIDYVIMHELCHTVEKNHSEKFWNLMKAHMPDCMARRKELRKAEKML